MPAEAMNNAHSERHSPIIVISSHVVRGSVGNRSVVFALEQLGFPVWAVPTILLAWHPGQGRSTRIVPEDGQFSALIEDLAASPRLGEACAIISGYFGDPRQAKAVAGLVKQLKARNRKAIFLCDPVCADEDGLYVPQAVAEAIRQELLPLADIATPNRSELEWIVGERLDDNSSIIRAARKLGPSTMLVTSAHAMLDGSIGNLLVTRLDAVLAEHRVIENAPNGTGDLFAAIFIARLIEGLSPEKALRSATAAVFEVVARAVKRGSVDLMLATDAQSLVHPMAMVQTRRIVEPRGGASA